MKLAEGNLFNLHSDDGSNHMFHSDFGHEPEKPETNKDPQPERSKRPRRGRTDPTVNQNENSNDTPAPAHVEKTTTNKVDI